MSRPPAALDRRAVATRVERAAHAGAPSRMVSAEIEARMAERLDYVKIAPGAVLDAGCGAGASRGLLRARYPRAAWTGADLSPGALRAAGRGRGLGARLAGLVGRGGAALACADMGALPFADGCFDLLWSNLALAWCDDAPATLAEFGRVLAPGGLLMFSTYGPDTLGELREAWRAVEGEAGTRRVHEFIDMHDLGDMLGTAGFGAPVMDMERITLTYAGLDALAADLRASGQGSARADRPRGLVTRRRWDAVAQAYEVRRSGGRLPATIEVVYGHAWRAAARGDRAAPAVSKLEFMPRAARKPA